MTNNVEKQITYFFLFLCFVWFFLLGMRSDFYGNPMEMVLMVKFFGSCVFCFVRFYLFVCLFVGGRNWNENNKSLVKICCIQLK